MKVLDTNVISEIMKVERAAAFTRWMDGVANSVIAMPTPALEEVRYGLLVMPGGARQRALKTSFDRLVSTLRLLDFDSQSAEACAIFRAARRKAGMTVELPDAQIAGIAARHDAAVATRNVSDFTGAGIEIINPWDHP